MRWVMIFILMAPVCLGQKIAVSPTGLEFSLFEGDTGMSEFILMNPNDHKVRYIIESPLSWIEVIPYNGQMEPGENVKILVRAAPDDIFPTGTYETEIMVSFLNADSESITLNPGIALPITVELTNVQMESGDVYSVDVKKTNSLLFRIDFKNTGNVIVSPTAMIEVQEGNSTRSFEKRLLRYKPGERKTSEVFLDVQGTVGKIRIFLDEMIFEESFVAVDPYAQMKIVRKEVSGGISITWTIIASIFLIGTLIFILRRKIYE